ncbi:MAG: class I SAM-dependent methyltransferase [Candidatus Babeliales bacterium]
MFKNYLNLCTLFGLYQLVLTEPKPYEQWWLNNINTPYSNYLAALQNWQAASRKLVREYIRAKNYASILDAGCGKGIEWEGFLHDNINIDYQGIDITQGYVETAQKNNINVIQGSIEQIPFNNDSFDIAYTRHVLEHLPSYHQAINELIRIARYEALIVFFIVPDKHPYDRINLITFQGFPLYNNYYSRKKIEEHCLSTSKVASLSWQRCSAHETILHIYMKQNNS